MDFEFLYHTHILCSSSSLQIYERFDADSVVDSDDARFEYFTKKVCLHDYHVFVVFRMNELVERTFHSLSPLSVYVFV